MVGPVEQSPSDYQCNMRLVEFLEILEENNGVREFQDYVRDKYGIVFDLRQTKQGVDLEGIQVSKESPRGTGTAAMEELVRWADKNGVFLTLSLGEKGYSPKTAWKKTTSKGRLEKFYRRFGFIPNRGRGKRYELSIYTSMYREPRGGINEDDENDLIAGWTNMKTGMTFDYADTSHYQILKRHWKEIGIPEEVALVTKDSYSGPGQLFAYQNGWVRWMFSSGFGEREVSLSGTEQLIKQAAPLLQELVKDKRPDKIYLDVIDPNKTAPDRNKSGSFDIVDRMGINQWFRQPYMNNLHESRIDEAREASGWFNVKTNKDISKDGSSEEVPAHYVYLNLFWREMGLDPEVGINAKDAFANEAQMQAYHNGWVRWYYSGYGTLYVSAPELLWKSAAPLVMKLIKEYQPEKVSLDVIDPTKSSGTDPRLGASFDATERMNIMKWVQEPWNPRLVSYR